MSHFSSDSQSSTDSQVRASTRPLALHRNDRQLPVFCPQCGMRIEVRKGLCGNRIIDAILLQAAGIGAELECQRCQTSFVFQKVESYQNVRHDRTGSRDHALTR